MGEVGVEIETPAGIWLAMRLAVEFVIATAIAVVIVIRYSVRLIGLQVLAVPVSLRLMKHYRLLMPRLSPGEGHSRKMLEDFFPHLA